MAAEFLTKGWAVTGTTRGSSRTQLHELADQQPEKLSIEPLDICDAAELAALKQRLSGRAYDLLFVNAGITNRDPTQTVAEVDTDDFINVMVTNALSPMRVIEALAPSVKPDGLIGIMSSGQGSITNNTNGMRDVYRGSKAALNQYMRSYAARQDGQRPLVLMAPGWVKTALGGENARYTIEETIPSLVDVLVEKQKRPGLEYLDFRGETVPW
jgi:NAD(P)-dependent dehydrogenase (short-subunit alcohol dehydrogenase family)